MSYQNLIGLIKHGPNKGRLGKVESTQGEIIDAMRPGSFTINFKLSSGELETFSVRCYFLYNPRRPYPDRTNGLAISTIPRQLTLIERWMQLNPDKPLQDLVEEYRTLFGKEL